VYILAFYMEIQIFDKINIEFLCTEMYNYKINCQLIRYFYCKKAFGWEGI